MLRRINNIPASAILALAVAGTMLTVACGSDPVSPAAPTVAAAPADDLDATTEEGSFAISSASGIRDFACSFPANGETVVAYDSSSVLSSSGKETVTCTGRVSNPPARTQTERNVNCLLPQTGEYSNISKVVVHPTGEAKLRCQSK